MMNVCYTLTTWWKQLKDTFSIALKLYWSLMVAYHAFKSMSTSTTSSFLEIGFKTWGRLKVDNCKSGYSNELKET